MILHIFNATRSSKQAKCCLKSSKSPDSTLEFSRHTNQETSTLFSPTVSGPQSSGLSTIPDYQTFILAHTISPLLHILDSTFSPEELEDESSIEEVH
ncbi:hypothetical protein CEXT_796971 [Caerostris extrusa]|uniref:Uncharacterized protein n=1 Tax=Caerostris extrusa TaxID=172846 RepID=A0AAV4QCM0_CAEEX|nr:hypothetical protein CEXT_796971 [Caerostris extrusa]